MGRLTEALNRRPEAMAWTVIWAAFVVFSLTVAALFLTARWFVETSTVSQKTRLEIIGGTVLAREAFQTNWVGAWSGLETSEGASLKTDANSQAALHFFDTGLLILFPSSEVRVDQVRNLRFDEGKREVGVTLLQGKAIVVLEQERGRSTTFTAEIPATGSQATLAPGSYTLSIAGALAQVKVRGQGQAVVAAQGRAVTIKDKESTQVRAGSPPEPPGPAVRDLLVNSDFEQGLKDWTWGQRDLPEGAKGGSVSVEFEEGKHMARFQRDNSGGIHGETFLHQDIKEDVSDFTSLKVSIWLRLVYHSVSGGGYLGSEYPVMIRVYYRSARGENQQVFGFYYHNNDRNPTTNGVQVPEKEWVRYTAPLDLMTLDPRPVEILALEVTASGHDWVSDVREVSLTGE